MQTRTGLQLYGIGTVPCVAVLELGLETSTTCN